MYARDTIVAIATPPGRGGIGIVRLSGDDAVAIAARLFVGARAEAPSDDHRLRYGRIVDAAGETIDEALAVSMRAPHSYTGEDVVELQCHGSPVVLERVLARSCECGARIAEPGEFTKRAFLNGRMDLVQAEAVAELIDARTRTAARVGLRHLSGALSAEIEAIRGALVDIKARTEVMIDFSEEEIDMTADQLVADVDGAIAATSAMLASYDVGRLLHDGVRLALLGRPNVGKSSLLNALLGRDRVLVSPIPGTTRDVISESLEIDGIPVTLVDTAGVRSGAESIESLGIQRTRQEVEVADAILVVLDASEPPTADDREILAQDNGAPAILVRNKTDLPTAWPRGELSAVDERVVVDVSALTGAGLAELRGAITTLLGIAHLEPRAPLLTLVRHRDALERVGAALLLARESLVGGATIDAAAVDIQAAVEHIGGITGEVTTEEVLDRIFRDFCIGK